MIKTKEEKNILIYSIISIFSLSLIFLLLSAFVDAIKWTWSISVLLGGITSIICYLKSNFIITKILYTERSSSTFFMILNNVISTVCFLIVLIINYLIPSLNIIVCLGGILVLKIITFIVGIGYKK